MERGAVEWGRHISLISLTWALPISMLKCALTQWRGDDFYLLTVFFHTFISSFLHNFRTEANCKKKKIIQIKSWKSGNVWQYRNYFIITNKKLKHSFLRMSDIHRSYGVHLQILIIRFYHYPFQEKDKTEFSIFLGQKNPKGKCFKIKLKLYQTCNFFFPSPHSLPQPISEK